MTDRPASTGTSTRRAELGRFLKARRARLRPQARHEVAGPGERLRRFVHPVAGQMAFRVTELDVPAVQDLRIAVYAPLDNATRALLPCTRKPPAPAMRRSSPDAPPPELAACPARNG